MEGPSVGEHRLPGNNKSTDNVGGVSPPQSTEGGGGSGGRARSSTGDIKPESSTSPRSGPEVQKHNTRKRIAEELHSTERTYVDNLRYLLTEYLVPLTQLLKEHPDVSGKELTMSFSGVNIICKLHEDLLVQLQARIVDWQSENSKVGDVLLNIAPCLKVYTAYVNNYESTVKFLSGLQQNKKFVPFFQSRKGPTEEVRGDWYLSQLLILPVQRIPRYELLLREMIKYTDDTHEAKKVITEVAQYLASLVKPSRIIVREGTVRKTIRGQQVPCLVVLFNDALLLAEAPGERGEQLTFLAMISLFEATVRSVGPVSIPIIINVGDTSPGASALADFHLQVLIRSKEGVTVIFYAKDVDEMRQWSEDIDAQSKLYTDSKRKTAESMPMAQACKSNDSAKLRQLLAAQPTAVNAFDAKGRTLLYFAAKKGHMEIVRILVDEFNADSTRCSDPRYSPPAIAKASGFVAIANLLSQKECPAGDEPSGRERKGLREERKEKKEKDREERKEKEKKDREEKEKKSKEGRERKEKDREDKKSAAAVAAAAGGGGGGSGGVINRRSSLLDSSKVLASMQVKSFSGKERDRIERAGIKDKLSGPMPTDAHLNFTRGLSGQLQSALRTRGLLPDVPTAAHTHPAGMSPLARSAPAIGAAVPSPKNSPLSSPSTLSAPGSPSVLSTAAEARSPTTTSPAAGRSHQLSALSNSATVGPSAYANLRQQTITVTAGNASQTTPTGGNSNNTIRPRRPARDCALSKSSPSPSSAPPALPPLPLPPASSSAASGPKSPLPLMATLAMAAIPPPLVDLPIVGSTPLPSPPARGAPPPSPREKKLIQQGSGMGKLALFKSSGGPPPPEPLLVRCELYHQLAAKKAEVERYRALLAQAEQESTQLKARIVAQCPRGTEKKARIVHAYAPKFKYELESSVGDTLTVEMNENYDQKPWYLAKRQGQVGLVQGVYVEVADSAGDPLFTPRSQPDETPLDAVSSPTAGGGGRARVAFEYQAQRDDELSLVVDDVIIVHQRSDSGWWEGELVSTKRRGLFPANYVVDMA